MTAADFNKLSNLDKYALLEDHGVHLEAFYMEGTSKVALFALHGFYVAVWLDQKKDKLSKASAFSSYSRLDPFLNEIDLKPLYSLL